MLHLRGLGGLCLAIVLVFGIVAARPAQASDVYSVADISIDERAANEVSAKTVGIAKAQREALRILFERLTLRVDHERLPVVTDAVVAQTIRDFAVSQERFGGGRYLASLSVRFKPNVVRGMLHDAGISYAEVASRPNLVLPVFETAGSTILWDEPNPWFDAWLRREPPTGLLPLVLPLRDLSDISEITAEQAVTGDEARLKAIAAKYKAFGVFVILAQLTVDPLSNAPVVDVTTVHHQPGEAVQTISRTFNAREGTDLTGLFDHVVNEVVIDLEESWKQANLQAFDSEQNISIVVPLTRLGDWLSVRRKISSVPSVKQMNVARLSVREARVDLMFLGQPDQLRRALALKDLEMDYQSDQDVWSVRPKATQ
ncbi:MAG: DUF2066 domain-containing protein [Alphaproteobacteria bacterium]|nr:DUF2066 domain-containing protein [Alphaproteobacteria bacterium]